MSAWLQTKSWEEAKEAIARSKGVAIVPIGSVELRFCVSRSSLF